MTNHYKAAALAAGTFLAGILAGRYTAPLFEYEEASAFDWDLEDSPIHSHGVDTTRIYRDLAYDAGFPDPEEILQLASDGGITRVSAEGAEKMREDSERRLAKLEPVAEILERQALFGAVAFVEAYNAAHEGELDDDTKAELLHTYNTYGYSLLMGAMAGLHQYVTEAYEAASA